MADDDTANLFGLDDSSLGILDDRSASADINTDNSYTSDDAQLDSSGWEFPDSIPFTFDTSGPAMAPSYPTSVWDSPPFALDQSPSQGFDELSPSNSDPLFMFGGPLVSPPQQKSNLFPASAKQPGRQPITTLTPAAEEKLRNIAMPPHLQYHSPRSASSPESTDSKTSNPSKSAKKRKASEDLDEDEDEDEDGQPVKKTSHNMIEKRYRNNLNDKIAALRDSVPSLRIMSKSARGEDTTEDRQELHGLTPAHKLNKATVLSKATEYIRHLEKRYNRLQEENNTMRARIAAFEKLFMAGAMNGSIGQTQPPPTPLQYSTQEQRKQQQQQQQQQQRQQRDFSSASPSSSQDNSGGPSGMIQVPEDMKRILAAQMASGQAYPIPQQSYQTGQPTLIQQQQLQQQQQQEQPGMWGNTSPYLGKLMVGSLAGLMIIEAARDQETSNEEPQGRGLFALPLQLLGKITSGLDVHLMGYHVHTSLKLLLVIGTFLWVFVPSLFAATENKPKKPQQVSMLQPAPSLASSIHVRRQAWQTAVQSVWIPRHNFLLEVSALIIKIAKVSLLKLIGVHGYQLLSGATVEQERARSKAWSIAIDSQLAGGDVEINQSRLVITFLASATLPDTPMRLMLKSLHIRILLWDLSHQKWKIGPVNYLAESLARSRWNQARQMNRMLIEYRKRNANKAHEEELPDHLAQLVEQECEDVLNPAIIQRAHNLAFNKETRYGVQNPIDGMDSVVEDTAIGSPMDVVSAWLSIQLLHEALTVTLGKTDDGPASRDSKIELAIHTGPVGSIAQARAIVARAALCDEHRSSNIALAQQTIGNDKADSTEFASNTDSADMKLSMRCATALEHICRSKDSSTSMEDLSAIESITIPRDSATMSLLGFTSVMELIEKLYENKSSAEKFSSSLERLVGGLRLWIGGSAGESCGIDAGVRHDVVNRCLGITKSLVGMELDTGYGTLSDEEEE